MAEKYTLQQFRKLIAKDKNLLNEFNEIASAISNFADLMRDEMFDKAVEGYGGWDCDEYSDNITRELTAHIKKGNFVGAANFCMILHGFQEAQKKENNNGNDG